MTRPVYTFSESTVRAILREIRLLQRRADRTEKLADQAVRMSRAPRVEFAQPKTSLQVGSTCEALLAPWNGNEYAPDSRLVIEIEDLHGWAFAVGTDDWANTPHLLPVIESAKRGVFEVVSPFGLLQQCKPDANISSGGNGTASVYAGATDTGVNITLYVDWAEGAEQVSSGKESWAAYSIEQQRWNWLGGECE